MSNYNFNNNNNKDHSNDTNHHQHDESEFETVTIVDDTNSSSNHPDAFIDEVLGYDPKQRRHRQQIRRQNRRHCCRKLKCYFATLLFISTVIVVTYSIMKYSRYNNTILNQNNNNSNINYMDDIYTIRINAGCTHPYTDSYGNYWLPDSILGNQDDFVVTVTPTNNNKNQNNNNVDENMLSPIIDMCPLTIDMTLVNTNSTTSSTTDVEEEYLPMYNTDEYIYCTQRNFVYGTIGRYEIAIPENNAPYQIDVYFVENNSTTEIGDRIMYIQIENEIVYTTYDILQYTNGISKKATKFTFISDVNDGYVSIVLQSKSKLKMDAILSGIVVRRTDTFGDR